MYKALCDDDKAFLDLTRRRGELESFLFVYACWGGGGGCSDMLPNKIAWYTLLNIFPLIHI